MLRFAVIALCFSLFAIESTFSIAGKVFVHRFTDDVSYDVDVVVVDGV